MNLLVTYASMFILPLSGKYRRFNWRLGPGGRISIICGLVADALLIPLIVILNLDRYAFGPGPHFMTVQEILGCVMAGIMALDLVVLCVGVIMRFGEAEKYFLAHLTKRQEAEYQREMRRSPEPNNPDDATSWPSPQIPREQWNSMKHSWLKYREWKYAKHSFPEWLEDLKSRNPRLVEADVERSRQEALREWAGTYEYLDNV